MEMKLKSELAYIRERFSLITNLPEYAANLKENGNYKDFGTRLAWDCIHATIPSEMAARPRADPEVILDRITHDIILHRIESL